MSAATLTSAQLSRATLARQLLLERADVPVVEAVERLGGLQAQEARPPFIALWTRLRGFERDALHAALHVRAVVRATLMRATLHLVSAADYGALRMALQPGLTEAARGALRGRDEGLELERVLPAARELLGERPLTMSELRPALAAAFPEVNERALGYSVRTHLPLVVVPTDDRWAFGSDSAFAPAESWLGGPLAQSDVEALVLRYLGAFGPATVADAQGWSGLKGLKDVFEGLRDRLVVFRDERRRTLFDLPEAPRPDPDAPAPPRLLPEFDSLVLAHADRARLVDEEQRKALVTRNLRIPATFLVDGRVAGTWQIARTKRKATLELAPFARVPKRVAGELTAEAETLLAFAEGPDVAAEVTFRQ